MLKSDIFELQGHQLVERFGIGRVGVARGGEDLLKILQRDFGLAIDVDDVAQFLQWSEDVERINHQRKELPNRDLLPEDQIEHQEKDAGAQRVHRRSLNEAQAAQVLHLLQFKPENLFRGPVQAKHFLLSQPEAIGDTNAILADVIAQLQEVRSSVPEAASASKTQTTTQATSTDSGSTVGSVVSTVLKSGFGLAPLISGLVSLFSGGDATTPPPLVKYALPAAVDFQAEESSGQVSSLDYDQTGMPRSYAEAAASGTASGDANGQSSDLTSD